MLCHEFRDRYYAGPQVTCSFVGTTAALIMGGLAAAGSIGGAAMKSSSAKGAAKTQADSAQQAIDYQREVYGDQEKRQQPFIDAGQQSIGQLMEGLKSGTIGPGAIKPFEGKFTAPTLEEARATPGYKFTQEQGLKGIERSAAARGGLGSGSTLQALQRYGSGLADSTYNDVFNRSLSTYNTGMEAYKTNLQGQAQGFNQLYGVAGLGQSGIQNVNQAGGQSAMNIGNLMTQQGNATAAGQVGSGNAWAGGLSGAVNGISQAALLGGFGQGGGLVQPTIPMGVGTGTDQMNNYYKLSAANLGVG